MKGAGYTLRDSGGIYTRRVYTLKGAGGKYNRREQGGGGRKGENLRGGIAGNIREGNGEGAKQTRSDTGGKNIRGGFLPLDSLRRELIHIWLF